MSVHASIGERSLPGALAQAFAALEAHTARTGRRWAVLRGAEQLSDPGEDVDLLADLTDLSALDAALADGGWWRVPAPGRGVHRFWFTYDAAGDRWLKLDVVDAIDLGPWHEHRLLGAAELLARRRQERGIWRLDPDDEQWLHALHDAYDKGRPLSASGLLTAGPVPAAFDRLAGPGAAERVRAGTVVPLGSGRARRTALQQRVTRRLSSGRRLPVGRGAVVQVAGPDGAGKSTLAAALVADLPWDAVGVYFGLWRQTRLSGLPGARTVVGLGRAARASATARAHVVAGRVVVLDRAPSDGLLVDHDRSLGGRLLIRCALAWAPRPTVVVLLDAPGEVLFARSGEHTPKVLEARRQDYRRVHPDALVLDVTAPMSDVRRAALAGVWTRLLHGRA